MSTGHRNTQQTYDAFCPQVGPSRGGCQSRLKETSFRVVIAVAAPGYITQFTENGVAEEAGAATVEADGVAFVATVIIATAKRWSTEELVGRMVVCVFRVAACVGDGSAALFSVMKIL